MHKKSQITRTCLATAAALVALAAQPLVGQAQSSKVEGLEKLETLGRYPAALQTYAALPASQAELERRAKLADRLGRSTGIRLEGKELPSSPDQRVSFRAAQDPSAVFELDGRANLLFNGGLAGYRKDESTPGLPARSAVLELSKRHLAELALPLDEAQIGRVKVGGVNMSVPDGRGGSVVYEKLRSVRLERKVAGLPVEGDARVVVQLARGGSLAGLVYQWPSLRATARLTPRELEKPEQLRALATKQIEDVTRVAERSLLKAVELVLYDDGRGVVEPAYHIVVDRYLKAHEGRPVPFDFYVPVVVASKALFPHLEQAERKPADGRDERPTDRGNDDS